MTGSDTPETYGDHTIVERYWGAKVPEASTQFVLAHAPHRTQPWAVGGGDRQGRYFTIEEMARIEFADRIADSLGLVLGPPGSVIIPPDERHLLRDKAVAYRDAARSFEESENGFDGDETAKAVAMRDAADVLATQLQRVGVIAGVFESWEL